MVSDDDDAPVVVAAPDVVAFPADDEAVPADVEAAPSDVPDPRDLDPDVAPEVDADVGISSSSPNKAYIAFMFFPWR